MSAKFPWGGGANPFSAIRLYVDAHDDDDVDLRIVSLHVDLQPINFFVAVSACDLGILLTKCILYQEGVIDSLFSCEIKEQLREHPRSSNSDATQIPFFFISTRI